MGGRVVKPPSVTVSTAPDGRGPVLLLDCREGETLRGFHALAVAAMVLPLLPSGGRVLALTGNGYEETVAIQALAFDSGRQIGIWEPGPRWAMLYRRLLPARRLVDLFLGVADAVPSDAVSFDAIRAAKASLIGLTGGVPGASRRGMVLASGHDTRALAFRAAAILAGRGQP
jgi:hypothetical protein